MTKDMTIDEWRIAALKLELENRKLRKSIKLAMEKMTDNFTGFIYRSGKEAYDILNEAACSEYTVGEIKNE